MAKKRKPRARKSVASARRRRSVPVKVTNPKRRKRRRSVPVRVTNARRRRSRRRNPAGMNVNLPVLGQVNLVDVGGGTVGSILAKMIPAYAAQFGIPVTGMAKYPVQLGAGFLVSWLASNVLKQKGIGKYTALFTLNNVLTELATEFIVTPAGMGGLMGVGYPYTVTEAGRLSGAVQTGDNPTVLYQPPETARDIVINDVPLRFATRF